MLYVLVKKDNKYYVKTFNGIWNDGTCYDFEIFNREKGLFRGVFGIKDYAEIWRDFKNNIIDIRELDNLLSNY